jgi:hypothetical protein
MVLALAIVILGIAKMGITHPPAVVACILFTTGDFGWGDLGIFLLVLTIAIMTAACINNLDSKRQ